MSDSKTKMKMKPKTGAGEKSKTFKNKGDSKPKSDGQASKGGGKNKRKQDAADDKKWQPKSILQDSTDGPANKKRALRRQRNAQKPNFEAVCQSKLLWNELREKKCGDARRAELVGELHSALVGKYREVAMKHDASRLVQAVIQFGNEEQRLAVLDEVAKGSAFVEICRSTYAHYVVIKLIEYTKSKEGIRKLTEALRGNICALATHSVAARIIELAFMNFKTQQAAALRLELYGREFAVFVNETLKEVTDHNKSLLQAEGAAAAEAVADKKVPVSMRPTLSTLLAIRPSRSEQILSHVGAVVGKLTLKGLLPFQYAHELICEYVECCTEAQFQEVLPSVIEHSLVLLSTRPGTKVVCMAATRGGAKERRRLLKLIKGHAAALLSHRDAYLAVMVLCEVTDDTVALQNSILAELCVVPSAEDIANSEKFSANPFLDEDMQSDEEEEEEDGDDEEKEEDDEEDDEGNGMEDDEEEEEEEEEKPTKSSAQRVGGDEEDLSIYTPLLALSLGANSSKFLVRIACGEAANSYLDPYELTLLNAKSETSKKDPQVRRDELLSFLEDHLNTMVVDHAAKLLKSRSGGFVLTTFFGYVPVARTSTEAAAAVAQATTSEILDDAVAHVTLQNILKKELTAEVTPVATALVEVFNTSSEALESVTSSNRASFVVSALLAVPTVSEDLVNCLVGIRQEISEAAKSSKGATVLLAKLNELRPEDPTSTNAPKTPKAKKTVAISKSEVKPSTKSVVSSVKKVPQTEKKKKNKGEEVEKEFSPLATRSARKKKLEQKK